MALSKSETMKRYRERHRERLNAERAARRASDPDFNRRSNEYYRARRAAGLMPKKARKPLTPEQKAAKNAAARERRKSEEHAAAERAKDARKYAKRMAHDPDSNRTYYAKKGGRRHRNTTGIPETAWSQAHCDACGEAGRRSVIDHCHATNAFRGVLCDSCNLLLGHLERAAKRPALLAYARRHGVWL